MKHLIAIVRILLLAGLLIGQGALACPTNGSPGSADGCLPSSLWGVSGDSGQACCCGPDETRCDAPPDPFGAPIGLVRQAWDVQVRPVQICTPSKDDGCACWKPRRPGSSLPSALVSPFFEQPCLEPPLTIVVDPPRRVAPIRQVVLTPPPLRPPIEGEAWSIDLLPLPPPVRA